MGQVARNLPQNLCTRH